MPKRKVAQTVIVVRNGERVKPKIGAIFDFSADELKKIETTNPNALLKPTEKDFEMPSASVQELSEAERAKVRAEVEADLRSSIEAEVRAKLAEEAKASAASASTATDDKKAGTAAAKAKSAKAETAKAESEDEL